MIHSVMSQLGMTHVEVYYVVLDRYVLCLIFVSVWRCVMRNRTSLCALFVIVAAIIGT